MSDEQSHIDLSSSPYSSAYRPSASGKSLYGSSAINEKLEDYDSPSYDRDNIDDIDDDGGGNSGERADPARRIEVAELRVRLPQHSRWVRVDKCQFRANNRTLDTRLIFPDLTISGKVMIRPRGGHCSMILRLRQAGIEFRTVPVVEERSRAATVRTDSYFAEPGFISVFAHGCEGLTAAGAPKRPNSKRQNLSKRNDDWRLRGRPPLRRRYDGGPMDLLNARDDIRFDDSLGRSNGEPEDRTFSEYFTNSLRPAAQAYHSHGQRPVPDQWQNVELANSVELDEAFSRELEDIFSKGVRGLLTSYMQKALQPAIKETLMESMGYKLSYG